MPESPTHSAMNLLPIPRNTPSATAYTITRAGLILRENDSTIAIANASQRTGQEHRRDQAVRDHVPRDGGGRDHDTQRDAWS